MMFSDKVKPLHCIQVRAATLDDVNGIRAIHSTCEDPWSHPGVGPVWINHRLLRGFYVDVATIEDKIVGHAEWNITDEPAPHGRYLYLGMIQVHEEHQRKGVGQIMISAGVERARSLSCGSIRTVPDLEARGFYSKCGFEPVESIIAIDLAVSRCTLPKGWSRVGQVPHKVVASLPLRLGWRGQACSAFMWEICNRPVKVALEHDQHPCARSSSGKAYVQLRHVDGNSALAIAWATPDTFIRELIEVSQALAFQLCVSYITASVINSERDELLAQSRQALLSTDEIWERKI